MYIDTNVNLFKKVRCQNCFKIILKRLNEEEPINEKVYCNRCMKESVFEVIEVYAI